MKVNVYLKNMDDFAAMNEVYEKVLSLSLGHRWYTGSQSTAASQPETCTNLHSSGQASKRRRCRDRGYCKHLGFLIRIYVEISVEPEGL